MTTISPRRKKRNPYPALAVIVVFAVLVAVIVTWRVEVGDLFWKVVAPVAAFRNKLDATESAQLRAELAATKALVADRNALYQENLLLKAQFGRDAAAHTVLAAVLMRPPGTPYDTLLIDAGSNQGIVQNTLVSAGGNAYIGTITEVYSDTSRVTLFSAPEYTYEATVMLSKTGKSVPISLVGQGAGSMSAQVPSATPVSVDDVVIIPSIATAFAGAVSYIAKPEGESFETLYIHLPVDLFALQFVEVRKP